MSNYDVFKSRVMSANDYAALQGKIYGEREHYGAEDLGYYSNNLSLGFMGRVRVLFAKALAAVGMINIRDRDARIAAEVNRVGKTVIQSVGKDLGYYLQETSGPIPLLDEESSGEAPLSSLKSNPPALDLPEDVTGHIISLGQRPPATRRSQPDPKLVLEQRAPTPEQSQVPSDPVKMPPAFDLPNSLFRDFPSGN